ncbi:DUF4058 family protein [Crocosphaera subtropica]|uniref:DUF4058 family protein n=1 Tax=Crocosphaera subtropica TaxID=2546360 RepID=UPI0008FF2584
MNKLSPFPGMNPYLEASTFWSAFHSRLIVAHRQRRISSRSLIPYRLYSYLNITLKLIYSEVANPWKLLNKH